MNPRPWLAALATASLLPVWTLGQPRRGDLLELTRWLVRPVLLPVLWEQVQDSRQRDTAAASYAQAQQLLGLLPQWLDGHTVFAFRYVIDGGNLAAAPAVRASDCRDRLLHALGALEAARPAVGRREVELLERMAFLPEVAEQAEPGLRDLLLPHGGAAGIADRLLALAEQLGAGRAVRENRTFRAVGYAAALLAAGDRAAAIQVLELARARLAEVRERELANEYDARLGEICAFLRGETVDLTAVAADPRLLPLQPYLR